MRGSSQMCSGREVDEMKEAGGCGGCAGEGSGGKEAVRQNGGALEFAEAFKNNKEIVCAAVKTDAGALEYASEEMRATKEVAMCAIQHANRYSGMRAMRYISEKLKGDREVLLAAVSHGLWKTLSHTTEELQKKRQSEYREGQEENVENEEEKHLRGKTE